MSRTDKKTEKRKLGDIGENIACSFLEKRGFKILDRNYLRKWGEIDIIAKKFDVIRFVEVKSVSREVSRATPEDSGTRETHRPEENMHPWKLKRLSRVIQTYLLDKNLDCDWQLDLITVKLDMNTRQARVELLENIII